MGALVWRVMGVTRRVSTSAVIAKIGARIWWCLARRAELAEKIIAFCKINNSFQNRMKNYNYFIYICVFFCYNHFMIKMFNRRTLLSKIYSWSMREFCHDVILSIPTQIKTKNFLDTMLNNFCKRYGFIFLITFIKYI